ncbi:tetratricopeptide repeat-containing sulfotransferase family protein [Shimia sagamensis]|uniref:Tfp pilus assembly protein PilF n=1 Tax=Shimia sagamensis TaxID=1566352 RepID=A0ABY1NUB0_9RHOB|nr:tetratricopeptide repeat-containing sulfotransferase family protein [Shimia sagamensis]SMP18548.1 Tfp pilus assembly protein PilF [Shimia sagamensis]
MRQNSPNVSKTQAMDLGVIQSLYDKGEFRKVVFRAQKALKIRPGHVGLHALAGFSAQQLGDDGIAETLLFKAAQLAQEEGNTSLELPLGLVQAGRHALAVPLFVACLKETPEHAAALNGLGRSLLALGEVENAIVLLGDALKHGADQPRYAADLGAAFEASGQPVLALECYEIARKLAPKLGRFTRSAKVMYGLGQFGKAVECLEEGLALWPDDPALLSNYASVLNALGRRADALTQWQKVLEAHPSYSIAYSNFANSQKPSLIEGFEDRIDAQLKRNSAKTDVLKFRYAKVAVLEERGDYEVAYRNLLTANALRFEEAGFDIEAEARLFDQIKQQFEDQPELELAVGESEATPIFILGMPRAGSSLTETIIGRHSEVEQKGELDYLALLVNQLGLLGNPFDSAQANLFRQTYLSRLTQTGGGAFITDKMPQNFRLIGHIATAMPMARIVHVHRDPKACCWSNFRHFFASDSLGFTNDVDCLIRYYDMYCDMMRFWSERFPGRIIDVNYENLVADPGAQIPVLIQSLGLEWQEECLAPQDSATVVRTASQDQVRQKIYKGSAQGWRKYEAQAGKWLDRLPSHQPIGG